MGDGAPQRSWAIQISSLRATFCYETRNDLLLERVETGRRLRALCLRYYIGSGPEYIWTEQIGLAKGNRKLSYLRLAVDNTLRAGEAQSQLELEASRHSREDVCEQQDSLRRCSPR